MEPIMLPIHYSVGNVPTVCSTDFADGLGIEHKSLIQVVRLYLPRIEQDFGRVTFEMRPFDTAGGMQKREVALLTEDQALFVGSLSRNSERVVELKSVLVRSFAEARRRLAGPALPSYQIIDPIERAKAWIREQEAVQALQFENAELRPRAEYANQVLDSSSTLTTTKIAGELGMSAIALNRLLQTKNVQYKRSGMWNLTARYTGQGYAKLSTFKHEGSDGKPRTEHSLVWTERGREFIHRLVNPGLQPSLAIS